MENRTYIAIDLKSFYAAVECRERGLDPLTTNLVVADRSRTEKTICLAVSPPLKAYGIPGRARLFEVVEKVGQINALRRQRAPNRTFTGSSCDDAALHAAPQLALDYLVATPRMALYIDYSTRIYNIYLRYFSPEDIHVYSIDEVFIDATAYLRTYGLSPRDLTMRLILEVLRETGITATAGIGPNLYLCKVAMDIWAKHIPADANGVRIAQLSEQSYRRSLWAHRPLTDFWRVGPGLARKLEAHRLFTMGDIARCSLGGPDEFYNEDLLYRLFGVEAELLIDHAWGWEPCTMAHIKAYKPRSNSLGSGQVLQRPYSFAEANLIVREMADQLALDLVARGLVTDQLALHVGYDRESLRDPARRAAYQGECKTDHYGRTVPKSAHGSANLGGHSSSAKRITQAVLELYDRIVDRTLLVRRVSLTANHVLREAEAAGQAGPEQLDFFTDRAAREQEEAGLAREKKLQQAMLSIREKYGKNAILKGMNLEAGATMRARNLQIGGHKA